MRANEYLLLATCIENGIAAGLRRMDKHATDPLTDDQRARAEEHLEREVMSAICEYFTFPVDTEPEGV